MCGIAGFLDPSNSIVGPDVAIERMLDSIQHRGPDDWGKWGSTDSRVLLGHRRLSILDTSESARQPYASPSGRYQFTFNGEIYNFQEVRNSLAEFEFKSSGDTAVIAAALDKWGVRRAIEKFNGMFALGIWDHKESKLTLIRDRLGKKPIYYGQWGGVFAFASELKPFRTLPGFCEAICPTALEGLLKYGYVSAPRSIFKSIRKLRAGELVEVRIKENAVVETAQEFYWHPQPDDSGLPDTSDQFLEFLEQLLSDSVRIRMISDVPLGAFLSGGIDSSLVCALMAKQASGPVKTFSIGFKEAEFDEAVYARKIAKHLGTEHHELYLTGSDSMDLIEKMPDVYNEPFADSSQLPTYLVSQFARQNVTVALSGDGGDELFSGYTRYQRVLSGWDAKESLAGRVATGVLNTTGAIAPGLTATVATKASGRQHEPLARRKVFQRELERRNAKDFLQYYQLNNSNYSIVDSLLSAEFRNSETPHQELSWPVRGGNRVLASLHDIGYYLPEDILTKVDRASMSVSLETRNPLLDYRLVGPALAALEKYPESTNPKWALKSILEKHVPKSFFDRPKQGFAIPFPQWMAGPLRSWAEELLSHERLNEHGYFDAERVSSVWKEFLAGESITWGVVLWRILMFQAWHERFFELKEAR